MAEQLMAVTQQPAQLAGSVVIQFQFACHYVIFCLFIPAYGYKSSHQ
jgi:hypothetical protein